MTRCFVGRADCEQTFTRRRPGPKSEGRALCDGNGGTARSRLGSDGRDCGVQSFALNSCHVSSTTKSQP